MKYFLVLMFVGFLFTNGEAQMTKGFVEYKDGDQVLEGYVAYITDLAGKAPAVVVVHEWTGINDYTKRRCEQLADLGYVAFAADIYGKGIRPSSQQDAAKQATIYRSDRPLMRKRVQLAVDELVKMKNVDASRIAAIGYCFGGGCVLELARSGANVRGVVSFHGNLDTPNIEDAKNIKGQVLVCHGADDPYVPMQAVETFIKEMKTANARYEIAMYGGAVHSFTNPASGNDNSKGVAYNKDADELSWNTMKDFFSSIFK